MNKVLYKEAKEVLENAMDYTRARVNRMRDEFKVTITTYKQRLDKIEQILDEYHIGRAQDVLGAKESSLDDYKDVTLDDLNDPSELYESDKSISPYSKSFMEDILKKCHTEDADGVEITIYKIGKRTEEYNYDKKD